MVSSEVSPVSSSSLPDSVCKLLLDIYLTSVVESNFLPSIVQAASLPSCQNHKMPLKSLPHNPDFNDPETEVF